MSRNRHSALHHLSQTALGGPLGEDCFGAVVSPGMADVERPWMARV